MQTLPMAGFAPSVDPTTPGILLDCTNLIPTLRGMKGAASPVPFGNPPFPTTILGAATCELLTGTYRTFAGDSSHLWEVVGDTNIDVSAYSYHGGINRWRFSQFGNASLAVNGSGADPLQQSIAAGPFTDVPAAIGSLALGAAGTNYTDQPSVDFTGGGGTGAVGVANLVPSTVASVALTAGGTGFILAPTVILSGGGGSGASAIATLTPTSVASVNGASGTGYTSPPSIAFSGGGGSGASATAILAVLSAAVTAGGSGYTSAPAVIISGGGGTGATATAIISGGAVVAIVITHAGSGFTSVPAVSFSGGAGTGAAATANLAVSGATVTAPGTGYTSAPTVTLSGGGGTGATGVATLTPTSIGSLSLTNGGFNYTARPTVNFSGGSGIGATGTAPLAPTSVASVTLENAGTGYTSLPAVTIVRATDDTTGSGATATATLFSAPSADIIETVAGFVFLFSTTDQINGQRPNGWYCSGLYDQTNWTPSQSTQCAFGVIVDTPGKITAGRALGTNILAFKRNSIFYGNYQGPPVIWAFNMISPSIGTPSEGCAVNVGTSVLFLGADCQVYSIDNSLIPQEIGLQVKDWLLANWSKQYQENVESFHDQPNSTVYWYFCSSSNSTGIPDTCLVYRYDVAKFGRADASIQATVQAVSGQITWDDVGDLPNVSTWNTLPQIPYNSQYWASSSQNPGYIDNTNTYQVLSGTSQASALTTGWLGDDYSYSYWQGIIPRFNAYPTTCTGTAQGAANLANTDSYVNWPVGALYDGEMAADFSARYTSLTLQFTGNHEIIGLIPRAIPAGDI